MNECITFSRYKNKQSIVLETSRMRAEFVADPGGKMVSLIGKDSGYEYLVQRQGQVYRDQPFDGDYITGECSGFDDMFPTIDECDYHRDPWKGVKMADHGETWSLPWRPTIHEHSVTFEVSGVRFPYVLKKNAAFRDEGTLRMTYTLTNQGTADFDFLWAGHLMVNMEEGTQLLVPDDCTEVLSVLSNSGKAHGEILQWPFFDDGNGNTYRADISRSADVEGFEKYYFRDQVKEGWCQLKYPKSDKAFKVSFSESTVPYLGILMNENGWDNLYNIFIEPCTVCFDRPDIAAKNGQVSRVRASSSYHWHMELSVK